jgi:SulP family sulfate permease
VVTGAFAVQQTARTARLDQVPLDDGDHVDEERRLLDEHIVAYRLDGPLFFAAAHDFLLELADVHRVRVVVLRMSRVTTVDATGARVLADMVEGLERRGVSVLLSGVRPEHERVLRELGVHDVLGHERHVFTTTPEALAHARSHVARAASQSW